MRTVLITGASGGIGLALCRAFFRPGDRVVAQYNQNAMPFSRLQPQAERLGAHLIPVQTDLSDPAQVEALADFLLPEGVDVLIHNAGVALTALFQDVAPEEAARLFQIDLQAAMRLTQRLLPPMIARKNGRIVVISSVWGAVGAACEVHYSAAKAALIGFTKALAKEVGPSGINVNCIAPGFIDTPMNAHLTKEDVQAILDETPLCRAGTPADVAELAAFLASDRPLFITGQVIAVDGGWKC